MRLADFIVANLEPILVEWESFARHIWPAGLTAEPAELRDEAAEILREVALDMASAQTTAQQAKKSQDVTGVGDSTNGLRRSSASHGTGRAVSGLELWAVVAEYRALRATVLRLWSESMQEPDVHHLEDITRFNESIDQSLTDAVRGYAEEVDRDRQTLLEREQASRREAEAANHAKDLFLATLSHEMRTPLNAITGWISILRNRTLDAGQLHHGLAVIERNTRAQVQLVEDLLDVSRIVSGKLRVDLQPCDLREAINAAVNATRAAAEARDISLDVRLEATARHVFCDSLRIQQVVWNLVSNAIKFTPRGGHVTVILRADGRVHELQVSDDGQGITPDHLPYVFDRFRQADSSMRRKFAGLGLGLSIVKYIVDAHGGTVEAASLGEGRGSTFTVRLPVTPVAVVSEPSEDQPAHRQAQHAEHDPADFVPAVKDLPLVRLDGVHILVVDDEPDSRHVLAMVLERAGATVATASSAREAIAALSNAKPNVLVSDLGMPEQDGLALIRQLRGDGHDAKGLPAIALTAFVQKDDARQAISAGYQAHLPKPVDTHELTSVIGRLVRHSMRSSASVDELLRPQLERHRDPESLGRGRSRQGAAPPAADDADVDEPA